MGGSALSILAASPESMRSRARAFLLAVGARGLLESGGEGTIRGTGRPQSPLWLTPTAGQSPPRGAPGLRPPAPRLVTCSDPGLSLSPQELLLFLQNLPTAHWGNEDISLLLAEAYRLKFAFADAPNHYKK